MKIFFLNSFAIVLVLAINACSNGQVGTNLSPTEFLEKIKKSPSAPIVDVRTPEEYSKGHIQNAQNIDWNGDNFEKQISQLDKSAPVFVYCLSGGRSSSAASAMRSIGFKEVYELNGGISQWRNAGLPESMDSSLKSSGMTRQQFDSLLNTQKLVLIDFYAEWCAPCKRMEPYLKELEKEKTNTAIIRINADENQLLFKELKIAAIPMLLLYKEKNLIWSKEGYVSKEEIALHLK